MFDTGWVYIHGQIVPAEEARVSVFDRAFLLGDSIFETLRLYDGVPFAWTSHLERLSRSASYTGIAIPHSDDELKAVVKELISRSGILDGALRLQVSRGPALRFGIEPRHAGASHLVAMLRPLGKPLALEDRCCSLAIVDVRRTSRMSLDPRAKTGNYLNGVLAAREAQALGADEPLMLNQQGKVAEGGTANIFTRVDGAWFTPPVDAGILDGITRATLLGLARDSGDSVYEHNLERRDVVAADEVFLCSTLREMSPVVSVDGQVVGDGGVGGATRALYESYCRFVSDSSSLEMWNS